MCPTSAIVKIEATRSVICKYCQERMFGAKLEYFQLHSNSHTHHSCYALEQRN